MPDRPEPPAAPIGVFDSGVGGLTVLRRLAETLPDEPLLYLGDTARVPYGTRSASVVRSYAAECAQFLVQRGAKMVVVACNTASAYALETLGEHLPVPVVGVVEAGVAAVAEQHSGGGIGVLGTPGTIASGAYQRLLAARFASCPVIVRAAPLWVPLCEEGLFAHPATRLLVQEDLAPLLDAGVRTLLLGCTHYPLLLPLLRELCGSDVTLIDSASAAAAAVAARLGEEQIRAPKQADGARAARTICATDVHPRIEAIAAQFLGAPVAVTRVGLENLE